MTVTIITQDKTYIQILRLYTNINEGYSWTFPWNMITDSIPSFFYSSYSIILYHTCKKQNMSKIRFLIVKVLEIKWIPISNVIVCWNERKHDAFYLNTQQKHYILLCDGKFAIWDFYSMFGACIFYRKHGWTLWNICFFTYFIT